MASHQTLTFTPHTLSTDGRAVGRLPSGQVMFVAGVLPQEEVRVNPTVIKKTYCEGQLLEVLKPSPQRTTPLCPIYGTCGGCQLQHLDGAHHGDTKASWLLETLGRVGRWNPTDLEQARDLLRVEHLASWAYRQRVTAVVLEGGALGFQQASSHQTVSTPNCPLAHPLIQEVWPQVAQALNPRVCHQVVFTAVVAQNQVHVALLRNEKPLSPARTQALIGHIPNLWWEPFFPLPLDHAPGFAQPSNGFVQPHWQAPQAYSHATAQALAQALASLPPSTSPRVVWDLYGGCGLMASGLEITFGPLRGTTVEAHSGASAQAATNVPGFHTVHSDVGAFLASTEERPHAVVLDPPRGGCGPQVMTKLLERLAPASAVVFWGCDGATFARDTRALGEAGFTLTQFVLWDAFGQTRHYEVMGVWVRGSCP